MMVKVCGITRRADAETAAAAGADALGFIFFASSPRYVRPDKVAELTKGLAMLKVGIFVRESAASIEAVMRAAGLDIAQVYGGEVPQGVRVWKAFRVAGPFDPALADGAEAVLLDGPKNGVGFNWEHIPASLLKNGDRQPFSRLASVGDSEEPAAKKESVPMFQQTPKVILAGGLNPTNVAQAIGVVKPWGVDASSGLESAPGIKDPEKVRQFVEAARKAAA
jgi:phosphoribosylanthranilate isomerase